MAVKSVPEADRGPRAGSPVGWWLRRVSPRSGRLWIILQDKFVLLSLPRGLQQDHYHRTREAKRQTHIRGTRMTVTDVLEYLAGGMSEAEILSDFPDLTADDIKACLAFAADRERKLAYLPEHETAI